MEKRQLTRLYIFITVFGTFIFVMSMFVAAFYTPDAIFTKHIWAERIMIKGQPGQSSAWLGQAGDGEIGMFLYDQKNRNRMSIILYPDGQPGIELYDNNHKPRLSLTLSNDGSPAILIFSKDGTRKSRIIVSADNQKDIYILDEHGNHMGTLP